MTFFFGLEKILTIGDTQGGKIDPFKIFFKINSYDLSILFANGFFHLIN